MPSSTLLECDGRAASAAPHELVQHVFGLRVTADGGEDWEEESGRLGEGVEWSRMSFAAYESVSSRRAR